MRRVVIFHFVVDRAIVVLSGSSRCSNDVHSVVDVDGLDHISSGVSLGAEQSSLVPF